MNGDRLVTRARAMRTAARAMRTTAPALLFAATVFVGLTASSAHAADATVSIVDYAFEPDSTTVEAGATVTWRVTNARDPHTVTPVDPPHAFVGSGLLRQGDTFSVTFDKPGTYRYTCSIHPEQMRGTILVTAAATTSPTSSAGSAAATSSVPVLAGSPSSPLLSPAPGPSRADNAPSAGLSLAALGLLALATVAVVIGVIARSRASRP